MVLLFVKCVYSTDGNKQLPFLRKRNILRHRYCFVSSSHPLLQLLGRKCFAKLNRNIHSTTPGMPYFTLSPIGSLYISINRIYIINSLQFAPPHTHRVQTSDSSCLLLRIPGRTSFIFLLFPLLLFPLVRRHCLGLRLLSQAHTTFSSFPLIFHSLSAPPPLLS